MLPKNGRGNSNKPRVGKRISRFFGKMGRDITGFFNSSMGQLITMPLKFIPFVREAVTGIELAGRTMNELAGPPDLPPPGIEDVIPNIERHQERVWSDPPMNKFEAEKLQLNTSNQQRMIQSGLPPTPSQQSKQYKRLETTANTSDNPSDKVINTAAMYSPSQARAVPTYMTTGTKMATTDKFFNQSKALNVAQDEQRNPMMRKAPASIGFLNPERNSKQLIQTN